jgi:hypothetical protein
VRRHHIVWLVVACAIVYTIAVIVINGGGNREETFTSSSPTSGSVVSVYLDEVAFDPARQSIDVRIDLASGSDRHGARYGGKIDRDVQLSVDDGDSQQVIEVHRSEDATSHVVSLDLRGALNAYPFDRYRGRIVVSASERSPLRKFRSAVLRATIWEGVPGWAIGVGAATDTQSPTALILTVTARRPIPVVSFAVLLFALMIVVAVCSLTIGGMVFARLRKVESTIVGALVAMVFSIAALRNVLPGAPPVGVTADLLVFLLTEVAVIVGLSLLVTSWAKRGPGG